MAETRILLVYPNLPGMHMVPYSIGLFSRILKDNGFAVRLFDTSCYSEKKGFDSDKEKEKNLSVRPFRMGDKVKEKDTDPGADLADMVAGWKPDLVAVSVTEDMLPLGLKLLKSIDQYDILTIVGGVFPTFAPDLLLTHKEIDIVCVGEGERALLELCIRLRDGRSYDDIENLWVKKADGVVVKNALGCVMDMDKNPLPDYSLFEDARFYRPMAGKIYRMLPIETHRGCPYNCTYCNSPSQRRLYRTGGAGSFLRKKAITAVERDLKFCTGTLKADYFYFWADTFFAYTDKEFDEFVEMYADFKLPFWCQTRPETITEPRVRKLRDVGLHRMSIGIEHGDETFRKKIINRNVSNETIIKAFDILKAVALPAGVSVNNIVGFPTETRALAMQTIELNRKIADSVDTMNCYAFTPYHGTPLRDLSVKLGYMADDAPTGCLTGEPVLNMPQFSKEEIKGIMRTFSLYVRFEKSRWNEIAEAEKFTAEGDAVFERLRAEYTKRYFSPAPSR